MLFRSVLPDDVLGCGEAAEDRRQARARLGCSLVDSGVDPAAVGAVYIVSAFPSPERETPEAAIELVRQRFPSTKVVAVFLPGILLPAELSLQVPDADRAVSTFAAAAQLCLGPRQDRAS